VGEYLQYLPTVDGQAWMLLQTPQHLDERHLQIQPLRDLAQERLEFESSPPQRAASHI